MKKLSVVVAVLADPRRGDPARTTAATSPPAQPGDYLLSRPNEPFFAAAESIYDKVKDGEDLRLNQSRSRIGQGAIELCA